MEYLMTAWEEALLALCLSGKGSIQLANNLTVFRVWQEHTARGGEAPSDCGTVSRGKCSRSADACARRLRDHRETLAFRQERFGASVQRRNKQKKCGALILRSVCQHFLIRVSKTSARNLERCTTAGPDLLPGRRETVWRRWRPFLCSAWSFSADPSPPPGWGTSAGSRQWPSHFWGKADANRQRWKMKSGQTQSLKADLPEGVYRSLREIPCQSRRGRVDTSNLREAGRNVHEKQWDRLT